VTQSQQGKKRRRHKGEKRRKRGKAPQQYFLGVLFTKIFEGLDLSSFLSVTQGGEISRKHHLEKHHF
jgi:hypothetical protein